MTVPDLLGTVDAAAGAVRLERTLPATVDRVWDAVTDPVHLSTWLAPVESGRPGPGASFVIRMNERETATCTVTVWDPPRELRLTWDYTGEGPSELTLLLAAERDGAARLRLEHTLIPADPVQYGAGWHVHLDNLAVHLAGGDLASEGCEGAAFLAAFDALAPRYAHTAVS